MKAVVYENKTDVCVQEVEDARVEQSTDVVVRITSTGICGSDLHMYEGRTEMQKGQVLGHENMGVIEQVGEAVKALKRGDRVVLPFNIACGTCFNCVREQTHACLTANPDAPSAGYGYAGMGPYRGGQAELLRVPWAEFNCLKLPGAPGDALEDDFLLLVAGKARPSFIVSHRVGLDEAPEAYRRFDQRRDGYSKVILKPWNGAGARA